MGLSNISDHIQIKIKMPNPSQEPPAFAKIPKRELKGHRCSLHLQNQDRATIQIMNISKTSDHIQIKIMMPNPSQEPPASSKAPNLEVIDIDVFCNFTIEMES